MLDDFAALSLSGVPPADPEARPATSGGPRRRIPEAHTPFSWGLAPDGSTPDSSSHQAGGLERVSLLAHVGAVVRCHILSVAGSADWTLPAGPPQFKKRCGLVLVQSAPHPQPSTLNGGARHFPRVHRHWMIPARKPHQMHPCQLPSCVSASEKNSQSTRLRLPHHRAATTPPPSMFTSAHLAGALARSGTFPRACAC